MSGRSKHGAFLELSIRTAMNRTSSFLCAISVCAAHWIGPGLGLGLEISGFSRSSPFKSQLLSSIRIGLLGCRHKKPDVVDNFFSLTTICDQ